MRQNAFFAPPYVVQKLQAMKVGGSTVPVAIPVRRPSPPSPSALAA
jgi:hypothetical protein